MTPHLKLEILLLTQMRQIAEQAHRHTERGDLRPALADIISMLNTWISILEEPKDQKPTQRHD